ncbi:hypothetical protein WME98_51305 [Sorangium sp. So ce296]|uniref:hypothetical protein n=1 Tax=Sorangium sp. So ce296 TaxID=3133296 RepID=UPI003F61D00B
MKSRAPMSACKNRIVLCCSSILTAMLSPGCYEPYGDTCGSDNDCKGDRVCELGECVEPGETSGTGQLECGAVDVACNCGSLPPVIQEGTVTNAPACASGQHEFQSCGRSCGAGVAWRTVCHCGDGGAGSTGAGSTGAGGEGPTTCEGRPANIAPVNEPPFSCGAPGPSTLGIMADLNMMWESEVQACACGVDLPSCASNALALDYRQGGRGYVYYDPSILQWFLESTGTMLAPAWFLGHEVGHNIQQEFGAISPAMIARELGADCYSGYFIGWLLCNGRANDADVMGTLAAACKVAEGTGHPWFDINTHGTCQQRQQAISTGINAYLGGVPPLQACTF